MLLSEDGLWDEAFQDGQRVAAHAPWPRTIVDGRGWDLLLDGLTAERGTLLSLWAEGRTVHLGLLVDSAAGPASAIRVASLDCPEGQFPSVAARHPPASRLERSIRDLYGLDGIGAGDRRPWLDHGRWPALPPFGRTGDPAAAAARPYPFLPAEGHGLHQIPVGPVHAGIIEPGHFRFTANGEAVVRLEARLGYTHRGIDSLLAGAPLERATRLAGHLSGDSAVAFGLAFARAVEAALAIEPPPRAIWLRALMAELERLANHFGDIGGICNDAAFPFMLAHCGVLREQVLRASEACFGHRLLMDRVVPGGVAVDLPADGVARLRALVAEIRKRFPRLVEIYDGTASLKDRTVGTGRVAAAWVREFGCGGVIGRASGRDFDARRNLPYPPYDRLRFDVPTMTSGDVHARLWLRAQEVTQSLSLITQILAGLPGGPIAVAFDAATGGMPEGLAVVEGFRGDVLAWLRLAGDGRVAHCHLRDPSWFQWPLLESAIEGNIVADFPLCNKSFNCSYAGADL